jgi:hypothetical protein
MSTIASKGKVRHPQQSSPTVTAEHKHDPIKLRLSPSLHANLFKFDQSFSFQHYATGKVDWNYIKYTPCIIDSAYAYGIMVLHACTMSDVMLCTQCIYMWSIGVETYCSSCFCVCAGKDEFRTLCHVFSRKSIAEDAAMSEPRWTASASGMHNISSAYIEMKYACVNTYAFVNRCIQIYIYIYIYDIVCMCVSGLIQSVKDTESMNSIMKKQDENHSVTVQQYMTPSKQSNHYVSESDSATRYLKNIRMTECTNLWSLIEHIHPHFLTHMDLSLLQKRDQKMMGIHTHICICSVRMYTSARTCSYIYAACVCVCVCVCVCILTYTAINRYIYQCITYLAVRSLTVCQR